MSDGAIERTAAEWLERNGPQDEDEAQVAAHALLSRRDEEEAVAALEELGEFERQLIEHAYAAGVKDADDAVYAACGRAETIRVDAVRGALDGRRSRLETRPPGRPFRKVDAPGYVRAARLVASARRAADAIAKATEPVV